jgi:type III secretion protein U
VARPSDEATEDPTPRRLAEARRRGDVAFSRELSAAAAFAAAVAVLAWNAPAALVGWLDGLRATLGAAVSGREAGAVARAAAGSAALRLLGPPLGAVLLVALVVGVGQTGGLVLAPVRVDLRRLASAGGWRRLFDGRAALAIAQSLLKVALVAALGWLTLRPVLAGLPELAGASPARSLRILGVLTQRLAGRLALAALAFGVVDYLVVARRHRRSLRMTREEVKRDYKESEGDPAHRGERQRLHRELLEQRLIDDVRRADFVVVNPEHIAVALRYDPDGAAAPLVVAKGERLVAERIKQVAREAGVPIFRDVTLARALAELAEGGEIPGALYEAVAEILRAVQGLGAAEGRTPGRAPEPPPGSLGAPSPAPSGGARAIERGVEWKRV